jgi:hypothetical protein
MATVSASQCDKEMTLSQACASLPKVALKMQELAQLVRDTSVHAATRLMVDSITNLKRGKGKTWLDVAAEARGFNIKGKGKGVNAETWWKFRDAAITWAFKMQDVHRLLGEGSEENKSDKKKLEAKATLYQTAEMPLRYVIQVWRGAVCSAGDVFRLMLMQGASIGLVCFLRHLRNI